MNELGTDLVLICSSLHPKALGGIDRAADDFSELGERAAKKSIRVGYEALAWGKHVWDHRDAWEIVRRATEADISDERSSPTQRFGQKGTRVFETKTKDAHRRQKMFWSKGETVKKKRRMRRKKEGEGGGD